jgi:hypothetical protein
MFLVAILLVTVLPAGVFLGLLYYPTFTRENVAQVRAAATRMLSR